MYHSTCLKIWGQPARLSSLLLPCGCWELNSLPGLAESTLALSHFSGPTIFFKNHSSSRAEDTKKACLEKPHTHKIRAGKDLGLLNHLGLLEWLNQYRLFVCFAGNKGRQISVSSRPVWSMKLVLGLPSKAEKNEWMSEWMNEFF